MLFILIPKVKVFTMILTKLKNLHLKETQKPYLFFHTRYLKNPSHNPGDPQQSDVPFKRPKIMFGTDDTLWNKCRSYAREKFCDIENEARFVYKETKDYLKNRCEEAIK